MHPIKHYRHVRVLNPTFCQSQAQTRPGKPSLTYKSEATSAVAMGGQEGLCPLTTACAPISVSSEYVFETSRNDKTTGNIGKNE